MGSQAWGQVLLFAWQKSRPDPDHLHTKKLAWDAYYQIPQRCITSNTSNADFVFCSEDKNKQRQAFEEKWREQNQKPK